MIGTTIMERFWDSFIAMISGRLQGQLPAVVTLLQQAEHVFLGQTDDLTLSPAVQDVFNAMRVAGLLLLAFCMVISLAEVAESGIRGTGSGLLDWFKRFFVAAMMTFGGLPVYGIWIRLFNALLFSFRSYLDRHWSGGESAVLYKQVVETVPLNPNPLLTLAFAVLTLIILVVLWFLVGGVRQAELILMIVIAPVVWPLYLIPAVDDIPKTAFRGFLGLNAMLLFTVAMVRLAVRIGVGAGNAFNVWNLVPAIAMLVMTVFLPATVKRMFGQGQSGVGALAFAVQLGAGLKFLTAGAAAAGTARAAAAPPSGNVVPQEPPGPSPHPLATVPQSGLAGHGASAHPVPPAKQARATALPASAWCVDLSESKPGSGQFDTIDAIYRTNIVPPAFRPGEKKEGEDEH